MQGCEVDLVVFTVPHFSVGVTEMAVVIAERMRNKRRLGCRWIG